MNIDYRPATLQDCSRICEAAKGAEHENNFEILAPLNMEFAKQNLESLLKENKGAVLIAEDEDTKEILGCFAVTKPVFHWSNSHKIFSSFFFFVRPEHRNKGIQKKLLEMSELFVTKGLKENFMVSFIDNDEDRIQKKERFLRMNGYKKVGVSFVKEAQIASLEAL